jgi:glycosyltransferase involved in cell wall biosynthesis
VIATHVGANARLLDGGRCGVLVPPGDEAALVEALGELLASPLRAAGFGAAARRRVDAEFSRDAMRQRFERFYADLAGR